MIYEFKFKAIWGRFGFEFRPQKAETGFGFRFRFESGFNLFLVNRYSTEKSLDIDSSPDIT